MPWSSIDALPDAFNGLTDAQKERARKIANSMLDDGKSEEQAIRGALSTVKTAGETPTLRHVTLATKPQDDGVSDWFAILRADEWNDPRYGGLKVTTEDLDKAIANFNAFVAAGQDVPIDYDHSFQLSGGQDSRAAGWYRQMKRVGDKLMAKVEWTKGAAKAIADGEYRYFSSEYHEEYANSELGVDGFTILSGGLTNRPAIKGLGAVALSEEARSDLREQVKVLADLTGLEAPSESGANIRRELAEKNDKPDRTEENSVLLSEIEPGKTLTVKIDDEDREIVVLSASAIEDGKVKVGDKDMVILTDEAHKDLKKKAAASEAGDDQIRTLTERVESQGKQLTDERFGRIFSQAQREGRVDAKEATRKTWRERVDKFGMEEVEKLLSEIPAETIPVRERGGSPDDDEDGDAKPSLDTAEGRNEVNRLANELMAGENPPKSFSEAVQKVIEDKGLTQEALS